ncbi:PaaI family thioesterase [Paenibacillus sp. MBLB4367]|uniref:PaaI family thioesterase n=1 Tax=Paenibacillus sp. MBLB4367 TaxID=3384767 RepID=UPI003907FE40
MSDEEWEALERAAQGTFWTYLGCKLDKWDGRQVVISLDVQPHHLNLIGILHGGVHASLLDNAMGLAAMASRPKEKIVTAVMNVHFVSPIRAGLATVTAEIVHSTRKGITAQGRIVDADGRLGSIGTGSFRVT